MIHTAYIQWKGTDVCMDLQCPDCDELNHYDGGFAYYVQCSGCKAMWKMGEVQFSRPASGEDCEPFLEGVNS